MSALERLEAAHREFDRIAAETLALLEEQRIQSLERQAAMSAVTREAIAECNKILEKLT